MKKFYYCPHCQLIWAYDYFWKVEVIGDPREVDSSIFENLTTKYCNC